MSARSPEELLFREQRRGALRRRPGVSGLDFVESMPAPSGGDRWGLTLHFIGAVPPGLGPAHLRFRDPKGEPDPGFTVESVTGSGRAPAAVSVVVRVDDAARAARLREDPSEYSLELRGLPVDRFFSLAPFRFDGEIAGETATSRLALEPPPAGDIDYLAKDYASFRQLMLERMAVRVQDWAERNPADLGVTIVELLAYAADQLSYFQDGVATEAYLDTARRRTSVRRHLRLLGHLLHEGTNTRAWVTFEVRAGRAGRPVELPRGTRLLTRAGDLPPVVVRPSPEYDVAIQQGVLIFETLEPATLFESNNRMPLYTWGADELTLPRGTTTLALAGHGARLEAGDVVILEEQVEAAGSGERHPGDPRKRHAARLRRGPRRLVDPVTGGEVTEIELFEEDALPFALIAAGPPGDLRIRAAALGNVVLADHGETVREELPEVTAGRYAPALGHTELTRSNPFDPAAARVRAAARAVDQELATAVPDLRLVERDGPDVWRPRPDLLESSRFACELVVETESDGGASLRFGDGTQGRRPATGTRFEAIYRTGSGPAGHVGPDAIRHVVSDGDLPIESVRNPLAGVGGEAPEALERARLVAPRVARERRGAVTADDCARLAEKDPEVHRAAARLRWTGSWSTVFLHVQRFGGGEVGGELEARLRRRLEPRLLAGRDLEIVPPRWLSLELHLRVVLDPAALRESVRRDLLDALGEGETAAGRRGLFHPLRFTFGEPLELGTVLDAASAVHGVRLAEAEVFRPVREPAAAEAAWGQVRATMAPAPFEIVRLRNLPSRPALGTLSLSLEGGA